MTDCDFLLEVLADGEPHTLNEILQRSFSERGCGLTVHSRVADLRTRGHIVAHETVPGRARGAGSAYRLVTPRTVAVPLPAPLEAERGQLVLDVPRGAYEEAAA